jgi:GDP/UDP-N,N'-diacetylbacillosamine 2-epimerase (hydrolysing)
MTRRVAIVTGTRAEYGLLRGVIGGVQSEPSLQLQLFVTGMHLSPEFGLTYREIEQDGFAITERVETLLSSDTAVGVSKAIGLGVIGFAEAFARQRPDIVVVLGDRFEIFAAATAALIAGIPIAHIHGGETTEGAFDEAMRHSVTKMAHLHFVAAQPYHDRVVQLGEAPERVFTVGGLGIDAIERIELLDRAEFEQSLDFALGARNLLITFHPSTLDERPDTDQFQSLLEALDGLGPDVHLIFTMPNADTGGRALGDMVQRYVAVRPNARTYDSLGQQRYLSAMKHVDGVVGNSSSGLAEAPSFHIGTINIGSRQAGRLRAASVIDCAPEREDISAALDKLFSASFKTTLATVLNPYGTGGASGMIVKVLAERDLRNITRKSFHDLPVAAA